jgi:hypothetical protein
MRWRQRADATGIRLEGKRMLPSISAIVLAPSLWGVKKNCVVNVAIESMWEVV